jgi:hypothetical protein
MTQQGRRGERRDRHRQGEGNSGRKGRCTGESKFGRCICVSSVPRRCRVFLLLRQQSRRRRPVPSWNFQTAAVGRLITADGARCCRCQAPRISPSLQPPSSAPRTPSSAPRTRVCASLCLRPSSAVVRTVREVTGRRRRNWLDLLERRAQQEGRRRSMREQASLAGPHITTAPGTRDAKQAVFGQSSTLLFLPSWG